jgi:heme-degrading monooxygenase HmoA
VDGRGGGGLWLERALSKERRHGDPDYLGASFAPVSWDEFERTYRANVITKGKGIKGLRGRWLSQDSEDRDTGFAVSLWESLADMQAYEQSALYRRSWRRSSPSSSASTRRIAAR